MSSVATHTVNNTRLAVQTPKQKAVIQPKLMVNTPGDRYEQEADAMANKVMGMQHAEISSTGMIGKSLQRKCAQCEEEEKKKSGGTLMRKAEGGGGFEAPASLTSQLANSNGRGSPLPQGTRQFMENAFSTDFSRVRVHTDSTAAAMSHEIHAKAFTHGNDIYFNNGQYATESAQGKRLLAHELTHTVQQQGKRDIQRECDPTISSCIDEPIAGSMSIDTGTINSEVSEVEPTNMSSMSETRSASQELASPLTPEIEFDHDYPWLFTVTGNNDDVVISEELYGPVTAAPIKKKLIPFFNGYGSYFEERYVSVPTLLQQKYFGIVSQAMQVREAELKAELENDVSTIKGFREYFEVMNLFPVPEVENRVIIIINRWSQESFPRWRIDAFDEEFNSSYLNKLFLKLSTPYVKEELLRDIWTNDYDSILNNFQRADEIRAIRDKYSLVFRGEEPLPGPPGFFEILWEDIKSGAAAERIGYYFLGIGDAVAGFVEGIYTLITNPRKVISAILDLPETLCTLWENRGALWDSFVNADPNQQARMIGRLFGEIELLLVTAGAGKAAGSAPKLELSFETAYAVQSGGTLARVQGGTIIIDLSVLGPRAAIGSSVMAMTADASLSAERNVDEVAEIINEASEGTSGRSIGDYISSEGNPELADLSVATQKQAGVRVAETHHIASVFNRNPELRELFETHGATLNDEINLIREFEAHGQLRGWYKLENGILKHMRNGHHPEYHKWVNRKLLTAVENVSTGKGEALERALRELATIIQEHPDVLAYGPEILPQALR